MSMGWLRCSWVVRGSSFGVFNYWTTLVPLITISHFSHQFVVLLFPQRSPTSVFVQTILTFHCFLTLSLITDNIAASFLLGIDLCDRRSASL